MNYVFLALGVIFIAYYLACGLSVRFGQSLLWIWLAAGIFCLVRFGIVQISITRGQPLPIPGWTVYSFRIIFAMVFVLFCAVEGFVLRDCFSHCPDNMEYLVVLGAKTGSVTMHRRVDAAYDYLTKNPDTVCIVSGGQGHDEEMSEAQCMFEMLVSKGIDESRIIKEEKSLSTAQNIMYTREIIGNDSAKIGLVTSDYHIFRAKALARKYFSGEIHGLPSRSSYLSFPHYAVREFATITVDTLRGNMEY